MEQAVSFMYHVFGTILFCLALAYLLSTSVIEQEAVAKLHELTNEGSWYQR